MTYPRILTLDERHHLKDTWFNPDVVEFGANGTLYRTIDGYVYMLIQGLSPNALLMEQGTTLTKGNRDRFAVMHNLCCAVVEMCIQVEDGDVQILYRPEISTNSVGLKVRVPVPLLVPECETPFLARVEITDGERTYEKFSIVEAANKSVAQALVELSHCQLNDPNDYRKFIVKEIASLDEEKANWLLNMSNHSDMGLVEKADSTLPDTLYVCSECVHAVPEHVVGDGVTSKVCCPGCGTFGSLELESRGDFLKLISEGHYKNVK